MFGLFCNKSLQKFIISRHVILYEPIPDTVEPASISTSESMMKNTYLGQLFSE